MKVAFFFSYSDTGGSCKSHTLAHVSSSLLRILTSNAPSTPVLPIVGEPGSDAASLMSEKLLLRPSAPELCPLRWLNLIPRRGLAMMRGLCLLLELEDSFSSAELIVMPDLECQGRCYAPRASMKLIQRIEYREEIVVRLISRYQSWQRCQSVAVAEMWCLKLATGVGLWSERLAPAGPLTYPSRPV